MATRRKVEMSRDALQNLRAGMVPRNNLQELAVGRVQQIEVIKNDREQAKEGNATFRFIEGKYGAGKTFLQGMIRNETLLDNGIFMSCELGPSRMFSGPKKQGLELYRTLMSGMCTLSSPQGDGGALEEVLDSYVYECIQNGSFTPEQVRKDQFHFAPELEKEIRNMKNGFAFLEVLHLYVKGYVCEEENLKYGALRWFRGEYNNKTEARSMLGKTVIDIVTDETWFDYLCIFAVVTKRIGYDGICVFLDELTQITQSSHISRVTRERNFKEILTIYNACYEHARYLSFFLCGIPSAIRDSRRGLFSYDALKTRINPTGFQGKEVLHAPIIQLTMLSPEEFVVLTEKLEKMHALVEGRESMYFNEEERIAFVQYEYRRVSASSHLTPREFIRDYITILDLKAGARKDDSMSEFLGGKDKIAMSASMIGAEDAAGESGEGAVSQKYASFHF